MRKLLFLGLTLSVFIFLGCSEKNGRAKIRLEFSGMKNKYFVMEEITPGRILFIDSVETNNSGKLTYRYKFRDENPVFLRIRDDEDYLTLLVSPGEDITVKTIINLASNYTVEGSKGSSLVRQINLDALETNNQMSALFLENYSTTLESEKLKLEIKLSQLYKAQKAKSTSFVAINSKSMASIVALYQELNGNVIFGGKDDFLFFKLVADSLSKIYPTSPHVKHLMKHVENQTKSFKKSWNIREALPDINLPDIYNVKHNLGSLLEQKAILLTFWIASDSRSGMLNKEMKELYSKMKDRDFEIFQVSLDDDKNIWVNSIVDQNIPWISVRDERGLSRSVAALNYNIRTLPSNYLISKEGVIIGKNLWGSDLVKKIEEIVL